MNCLNFYNLRKCHREYFSWVNISVIFSGKPIGPEEFLIQMVEILGIIIDRYPKVRPRKMES